MTFTPSSSVRDIAWPALVEGGPATLLAILFQLERSQWWSPDELSRRQGEQLAALLAHARAHVPFYRERLRGAASREALPGSESWRRIPLLTRDEIRQRREDLVSARLPPGHGPSHRRRTSGSTGAPLEVIATGVTGLLWQALTLRDDLWHRRDVKGRLVSIRSGRYASDPLAVHDLPEWGFVWPPVAETGPMTILYHATPIPQQLELLRERSPHYVLTYPSNARALCRHARRARVRLPDLRAILTYGEPLTDDVRAACRATWGVPVEDVYGCEELGYVALQCPDHDHHHVQSESVLVEVLDPDGRPTRPGAVGAVVLTSLHNFAMPLIRYAIGDYAEVGARCPCGRGLPVLGRVLGKGRGRVALPDGRRAWPDVGGLWAAIEGVDQIQVVQHAGEVEVRFARERPIGTSEQFEVQRRVRKALGHAFPLTFTRVDAIPRLPNGKYETFTCEAVDRAASDVTCRVGERHERSNDDTGHAEGSEPDVRRPAQRGRRRDREGGR